MATAGLVVLSVATACTQPRNDVQAAPEPRLAEATSVPTLKRYFRKEYDAATEKMTALAQAGDQAGVTKAAQAFTAGLIAEYGDLATFASDDALRAWLSASKIAVERVLNVAGPRICLRIFTVDPDYIPYATQRFSTEFGERARSSFEAIGSARESPVARAPATEADWTAFREDFVANGGRLADLDKLTKVETADETMCPTLVILYETLLSHSGDVGVRVRGSAVPRLIVNSATPPR